MNVACLLLHGFCGSPFEMQPLAVPLEAQGYAVSVPVLPGHGADVEAMLKTGYTDWLDCALGSYDQMAGSHDAVAVCGFSMGAALALHVAQMRKACAVVALAPPIRTYSFIPWKVPDWRLPLAGVLQYFQPVVKTEPRSEAARAIAPWEGYDGPLPYDGALPVGALHRLGRGLKLMRRGLPLMSAPLLIISSKGDCLAPPSGALEIARLSGSEDIRVRLMTIPGKHGQHMLTTHMEYGPLVVAESVDFVRKVVAALPRVG